MIPVAVENVSRTCELEVKGGCSMAIDACGRAAADLEAIQSVLRPRQAPTDLFVLGSLGIMPVKVEHADLSVLAWECVRQAG